MQGVWGVTGWLAGGPGGAEWSPWLGGARAAANLVIVVSNVYVARVLFTLRRRRRPAERSVSGLVSLLAVLIALCGASHLGLLFTGQAPARPSTTALKVVSAAFWVMTAVRLPTIVARLMVPSKGPAGRANGQVAATSFDVRAAVALALKNHRLIVKARTITRLLRNEHRPLGETAALRELHEILADLEAEQCKI